MIFKFGQDRLTTEILYNQVVKGPLSYQLPETSRERVRKFRNLVQNALDSGQTYYGINTGFGYLSDVRIDANRLNELQENLIRSHACGVGEYVEAEVVRGLLFLRAHTFSLGHSGVSESCLDSILGFLQNDILPQIPGQGSVGASGDLAPLAHLALGLIGEGEVKFRGSLMPAAEALSKTGLKALRLGPKEGLSLINGTHFMAVEASIAIELAKILIHSADLIAALSLDAVRGTVKAFDPRIHAIRPHPGQQLSAGRIAELFKDSDPILESHSGCSKVQDPYSFRCIPQVHGASYETLNFIEKQINIELNSVTDNPLCFENGDIVSGGNFHGQIVAFAMDFLCIAMAEIGSISERRTEKLTNPTLSGLPAFLTRESGVNSGYMIPHVVSAALVSENKVLAHPASVDSIPTSADKEDHVSMGPIAALKARRILTNLSNILAIELLSACQGIDLLKPLEPNVRLKKIHSAVREVSPLMDTDRSLHRDIKDLSAWISSGGLLRCLGEGS